MGKETACEGNMKTTILNFLETSANKNTPKHQQLYQQMLKNHPKLRPRDQQNYQNHPKLSPRGYPDPLRDPLSPRALPTLRCLTILTPFWSRL